MIKSKPKKNKLYYHHRYGIFRLVDIFKHPQKPDKNYNLVIKILHHQYFEYVLSVQHWTPKKTHWDNFVREMTIDEYMVEML